MVKNTTTKNKKPKKLLDTTEKPSRFKSFLNHPLAIPFFIFLAFFLYVGIGNYSPRPLASGFTYIGRDYSSGCIIPYFYSFVCMSPGGEQLYYATDTPPEEFADSFEGWKVRSIDKDSVAVNSAAIVYIENKDTVQDGSDSTNNSVKYIEDQDKVRQKNLLIPVYKKYLVEVWAGTRQELKNEI